MNISKHTQLIKEKAKKHGRKVSNHIIRHHKKYIFGGLTYVFTHLFILKIFLLKTVLLKVIITFLAIVGIQDHQLPKTFAQMESICINQVSLIPLEPCKVNFTNIQDAISYLEEKIGIRNSSIHGSESYGMLTNVMKNYCPKNSILDANKVAVKTIRKIRTSQSKETYKKLLSINDTFEKYKDLTLAYTQDDEAEFCETKYKDYKMLYLMKGDMKRLLLRHKLLRSTNNFFVNAQKKEDGILLPTLSQKISIANPKTHASANTLNVKSKEPDYKSMSEYSKKVTKKIIEFSEIKINETILKLEDLGVLGSQDINKLENNINVEYVVGCDKTRGYYTVLQALNNNKEVVKNIFKNINLKINICMSYPYINQLENYVEQITVHELGHYVYYAKDKDPKLFEKICRSENQKKCESDSFFSEYSQTGPEEDYAESLLHRYLNVNDTDKFENIMIPADLAGKHYVASNSNVISNLDNSKEISPYTTAIRKKIEYFSTLFK